MKVVTSIAKMQELSRQFHRGGLTVGFVPTMGYLHDGHLALVRAARETTDVVVVSIFVNPTQFDRRDDFEAYPRDERRDRRLLEAERVDVLFEPDAREVYPDGAATRVHVARLTDRLCGPRRPGHFDGVATVVAALFNMVGPDIAWFGEKDFQQLQVIRRMVADLHFPVEVRSCPTVREPDGLAMSSRNARLSPEQRATAPLLARALEAAVSRYAQGERDAGALVESARRVLRSAGGELREEYLELVAAHTLEPVERAGDDTVIAAAVWLGEVRLIDNMRLGPARASRCGADAGMHTSREHDMRGGFDGDA